LRWGLGRHTSGLDRLQLFCTWSDFADWIRSFSADCDGGFSAAQMARGGIAKAAKVRFEVIEPVKRPVMADADNCSVKNVVSVEIESAGDVAHRLLFDPDHGLEERLIREQFA
jgi:hypothetical protein